MDEMPADNRGLRLSVFAIVSLSLFVALFARLWFLQVADRTTIEEVAAANRVREVQIPPMRGRILDRQGRVLADNRRTLTVVVDREVIKKQSVREPLFLRLAGALGTTPEELEERYQSDLYDPFLPLPLDEDVEEAKAVYLKERREDYPGVEVEEGWQRVYRFAPYGSHIIGYTGRIPAEDKDEYLDEGYLLSDTIGRNGVELVYEADLRGTPGKLTFEVDSKNRIVRVLERIEPTPGHDVQLTIDLKLQQYAEQVLQAGLEEARLRKPRVELEEGQPEPPNFQAPAGAVVVQDPNDGAILAMASNPTYDNRWFAGGLPQEKFKQLFPEGPNTPLVNRATSGRYQLGSTMKLFTSFAALNSGFVPNTNWTVDDGGEYTIPNCAEGQRCTYRNAGGAIYGRINMPTALAVSSDVFYYKLGVEMFLDPRPELLQSEVRKFGLGSKTGIDLPYEYGGIIPNKDIKRSLAEAGAISKDEGRGYFTGDNLQLAIGQGLLVATPLQLANGYSTVANGGTVWQPHVVRAVYESGAPDVGSGLVSLAQAKLVRTIDPRRIGTVTMDPEHRGQILQGLIGVMRNPRGTAYDAFTNYDWARLPLAGKTGTAQDATKKGERDSSLFAAFGPVGANLTPQFTVAAVLEQAGYGAWAAAPVTKCIFEVLSGARVASEPQQADLLDRDSTRAAALAPLADRSCLSVPYEAGRD
jgi:penicillin-binding protein 2